MKQQGKFWVIMGKIADMILVSLLWLVGCIPVITAAVSSIALYYTTAKCIRHTEGYVFREFWHAYRSNLKQGLVLGVIYAVIAVVLYALRRFVDYVGISLGIGGIYYVFIIVSVLLVVSVSFYLIPVIARFTISLFSAFRLSLYLGAHNLGTKIPLLITFAAAVALVYVIPVSLVIVPGFYAFLMTRSVEKALRKYIRTLPDAEAHEGMWYMEEE